MIHSAGFALGELIIRQLAIGLPNQVAGLCTSGLLRSSYLRPQPLVGSRHGPFGLRSELEPDVGFSDLPSRSEESHDLAKDFADADRIGQGSICPWTGLPSP